MRKAKAYIRLLTCRKNRKDTLLCLLLLALYVCSEGLADFVASVLP